MTSSFHMHAHACTCIHVHVNVHVLMRDEKEGRSKQARSAKQHSTPKAVTFPKKNELPRVGLKPTTLYTRVYKTLYALNMYIQCTYMYCTCGFPQQERNPFTMTVKMLHKEGEDKDVSTCIHV